MCCQVMIGIDGVVIVEMDLVLDKSSDVCMYAQDYSIVPCASRREMSSCTVRGSVRSRWEMGGVEKIDA